MLEPLAEFTESNNGGKDLVPVAKQLLVCLWYNSAPETLRVIANRFNHVGRCILSCICRVTRAIKNELSALLIQWPTGRRAQEVMESFSAMKGFPRVLGATDGCHVPIKAPNFCPKNTLTGKVSILLFYKKFVTIR